MKSRTKKSTALRNFFHLPRNKRSDLDSLGVCENSVNPYYPNIVLYNMCVQYEDVCIITIEEDEQQHKQLKDHSL